MNTYDIVKKLIGETYPVGESHTDSKRLENLKETIELVESLVADIEEAAGRRFAPEASIKEIATLAYNFRISLTGYED